MYFVIERYQSVDNLKLRDKRTERLRDVRFQKLVSFVHYRRRRLDQTVLRVGKEFPFLSDSKIMEKETADRELFDQAGFLVLRDAGNNINLGRYV